MVHCSLSCLMRQRLKTAILGNNRDELYCDLSVVEDIENLF